MWHMHSLESCHYASEFLHECCGENSETFTEFQTSLVVTKNIKITFSTDSTYEEQVQNALP